MQLLVTLLLLMLSACGGNTGLTAVGNIDSLDDLQNMHAIVTGSKPKLTNMRAEGVQDIALSISAQAGLYWRSQQINQILKASESNLDRAFNFDLMLLNHNVVPPVLDQSENSLNLDDPQTIRISDRTYKIVSQAHFTTTPPNWRDYLWMNYTKPEPPAAGFLPQNAEEKAVWRKYSALGWQNGIEQANSIYAENLSRLKRDYIGMARYRNLLAHGMVSAPFVARTELGVTGDDSNLSINDQVLRITALPKLQTNPKRWKPILTNE